MSAAEWEGEAEAVRAAENVCGWCGIAAVDNIKLEDWVAAILSNIAAISVVESIVIGMLGIARDGQKNCTTENCSHILIAAAAGSAGSASCR
jgi:hypothetical protein